jgi:hypothetical protein
MNDSWGFLFIAGSAGLVGYHPVFQVQKKDCISGNTSNQCNLQFSLI